MPSSTLTVKLSPAQPDPNPAHGPDQPRAETISARGHSCIWKSKLYGGAWSWGFDKSQGIPTSSYKLFSLRSRNQAELFNLELINLQLEVDCLDLELKRVHLEVFVLRCSRPRDETVSTRGPLKFAVDRAEVVSPRGCSTRGPLIFVFDLELKEFQLEFKVWQCLEAPVDLELELVHLEVFVLRCSRPRDGTVSTRGPCKIPC
ncbi:uncharacterized protein PGTG_11755 [Puccinia graminis f. sp. tritici CRL 75-36-700-3]|uniref:Uncharacterized protein n=1 Tax=Puccinia graminis f. sp. tritici (strain CRL 75-36-700-3 / race SCCL) TaxID=418459 RepID=E3KNX4_PUCGT|nr:uncharacterized protein PGTG_11755 [Puccinia graminis f. sp. tritici CRL 75-36-700-3]EFP85999.1 hypothetical protein PGTG_11755 [Puccinia graminis f. sp. tritici CRL 75-36-700-3]